MLVLAHVGELLDCLSLVVSPWVESPAVAIHLKARPRLRLRYGLREVQDIALEHALEQPDRDRAAATGSALRDKFNIDHVLVGPGGVFAIETKFRSGTGEITFRNGEGLFVGGIPEEKNCLKQARANAAEISRLIVECCGRRERVTPLVVFVGDWRIRDDWRDTDTRVFTPDGLARYIRNQQPTLKRSEIDLIAPHLERSAKV
jgi:hypothetical protein